MRNRRIGHRQIAERLYLCRSRDDEKKINVIYTRVRCEKTIDVRKKKSNDL